MRKELTDKLIRETPPPERGYVIVWDTVLAGFGCRITAATEDRPAGARSFVLNYQASGRQRSLTIGSCPPWKTIEARRKAKDLKFSVATGADPVADKATARAAPTMDDLADLYRKVHLPRKRSGKGDESMLVKDILPALQHHKVAAVNHAKIAQLHRDIATRAPIVANRCMALLSKMFALAIKEGWRPDNPIIGVERMPENKRERFLNPDELRRLFDALDKHPGQSANAIRLLLLTGARKGEVLKAEWSQFDLDSGVWTKPSSHTKQKKTHRIPLSADAVALLTSMRDADAKLAEVKAQRRNMPVAVFLFPSKVPGQAQGWIGKYWSTIRTEAGINDVRVHDLRHSYASLLAGAGLSLPIIGGLLGHTQAATTQRYAHLLDAPLRAATEAASQAMADARKAQPKVVPLKKR